jgi:hypothetical protein
MWSIVNSGMVDFLSSILIKPLCKERTRPIKKTLLNQQGTSEPMRKQEIRIVERFTVQLTDTSGASPIS